MEEVKQTGLDAVIAKKVEGKKRKPAKKHKYLFRCGDLGYDKNGKKKPYRKDLK